MSKEGFIGVLEVKSTNQMILDGNIAKYEAMEVYCRSHGYLYAMIDPRNNYMTLEDLSDVKVNPHLYDLFLGWIASEDSKIDYDMAMQIIDDIISGYGGVTKTALIHDLAVLVAWFYNTIGVKGGNSVHFMAPSHVIYKKSSFYSLNRNTKD